MAVPTHLPPDLPTLTRIHKTYFPSVPFLSNQKRELQICCSQPNPTSGNHTHLPQTVSPVLEAYHIGRTMIKSYYFESLFSLYVLSICTYFVFLAWTRSDLIRRFLWHHNAGTTKSKHFCHCSYEIHQIHGRAHINMVWWSGLHICRNMAGDLPLTSSQFVQSLFILTFLFPA